MTREEDPAASLVTLDDSSRDDLVALSDSAGLDAMGFTWTMGYSPGVVSWPWLHENLYLQGNPGDQWVAPASISNPSPTPLALPLSPNNTMPQEEVYQGPQGLPQCSSTDQVHGPDGAVQRRQSEAQVRLVKEMVTYAAKAEAELPETRLCYWWCMSLRVAEIFSMGDWKATQTKLILIRMLDLYRENFCPLWPLLSGREFDAGAMLPLLFLTLASIGAMYGTAQENSFGTAMHEEIRKTLLLPLFEIEENEENLLPLCQARLLTQVASLYFGQRRAFSFSQHLGAVILAQARRMNLFSAGQTHFPTGHALSGDEKLRAWMHIEARKRLAFGILRADVFTSVLMNSRPLISAEEVEFGLPSPDHIWSAPDSLAAKEFCGQLPGPLDAQGLSFADLVRVTLDRSEALLDMEVSWYELLLFGLQEPVWRFSHDPHLFRRLTGSNELPGTTRRKFDATGAILNNWSSEPRVDHLTVIHRRMHDLKDSREQLMDALRKWEQSFAAVRTMGAPPHDRTSIMSSLLLYQLSYLRLVAPLPDLHSFGYALSNKKPLDQRRLENLTSWARSPEAHMAAKFSCEICSLVGYEIQQPADIRAKHNLLAFSGLHHAVIVLWVFAGSQDDDFTDVSLSVSTDVEPIMLCRRETTRLIKTIIGLQRKLTPVGWCSFVAAAERLSLYTFPARPPIPR
ncbi:hypothetical protein N7513_008746 [Penicillium frequentans]|nr:hypothetical protein N7513_008746 [Penicillium glabrum]